VILYQFNLIKLDLEFLKSDLKCKKEKYKYGRNFLNHSSLIFFRVQLKFDFRNRPLEWCIKQYKYMHENDK